MRIATLFLVIACSTLAGCATKGMMPSTRQTCPGADCNINVTVTDNGTTCEAMVVPKVFLSGGPDEKAITWQFAQGVEGYVFSGEAFKFAIFIKSDPGRDVFKDAMVPGNGKTLTLKFKRGAPNVEYEYGLTVRRSNGTWCKTHDPWLIS